MKPIQVQVVRSLVLMMRRYRQSIVSIFVDPVYALADPLCQNYTIFTPIATGLGSASVGLDLLTEATSSYGLKTRPSSNATFPSLSSPGPYNSMVILPSKVIKILDLEFVEMAEVTVTSSPSRSKDALQEGFQLPIFRTSWNSIH